MYFGMLVAIAVASQLPVFGPVFRGSSAPLGVVIAATVIFAVGLVDDVREMSPPAKLAGQVLAGRCFISSVSTCCTSMCHWPKRPWS